MKFKTIITLFVFFILSGCQQYNTNNKDLNFKPEKKYTNNGFALIYDENLDIKKKLDDLSLIHI